MMAKSPFGRTELFAIASDERDPVVVEARAYTTLVPAVMSSSATIFNTLVPSTARR
jgi:hypothetical protein